MFTSIILTEYKNVQIPRFGVNMIYITKNRGKRQQIWAVTIFIPKKKDISYFALMRLSILVVVALTVTPQTVLGSIPAFSVINLYGGRWCSVEEITSWLYCTMYNCTYYVETIDQGHLHPLLEHPRQTWFEPATSCTAGGHSIKELFEQLMNLFFLPNTDNTVPVHSRLPKVFFKIKIMPNTVPLMSKPCCIYCWKSTLQKRRPNTVQCMSIT